MCDVNKYKELYKELEQLNPEDTLELVLESDTEEEQQFFSLVGDFFCKENKKK